MSPRRAKSTRRSLPPGQRGAGTVAFDINRERILKISADLFARNGYHATGIAELSEAVGHGRGALYRYIGSKESLLYRINMEQVARMNEVADDIATKPISSDEKIRLLARSLIRNIAEHRSEWTVFFREYSALSGDWRDRVVAARQHYEDQWRQTLEQGVREGLFKVTPALLVKGILGMFNYTYLWYEADGSVPPDELADEFIDAVLYGIVKR